MNGKIPERIENYLQDLNSNPIGARVLDLALERLHEKIQKPVRK